MTGDDGQNDDILDALAQLSTRDVSRRHTRRLRLRCHGLLQTEPRPKRSGAMAGDAVFRQVIGPALAGAWCLAYLVEIVRRVAAVYLGTP